MVFSTDIFTNRAGIAEQAAACPRNLRGNVKMLAAKPVGITTLSGDALR